MQPVLSCYLQWNLSISENFPKSHIILFWPSLFGQDGWTLATFFFFFFFFGVFMDWKKLATEAKRGVFSSANDVYLFLIIFPRTSPHCKLGPVQYREYGYGLLTSLNINLPLCCRKWSWFLPCRYNVYVFHKRKNLSRQTNWQRRTQVSPSFFSSNFSFSPLPSSISFPFPF